MTAAIHKRSMELISVIPRASRMLHFVQFLSAFVSMTVFRTYIIRILHNICSLLHGHMAGWVFLLAATGLHILKRKTFEKGLTIS